MKPSKIQRSGGSDGLPHGFDVRDLIYLLVRTIAIAGGAAWALLTLEPGGTRHAVLEAFGVFAPYCVILYLAGARILRTEEKGTFYFVAFLSDIVFVTALVYVSGGISSPFMPALYLWSALAASYFGLRGGLLTAMVNLGLIASLALFGPLPVTLWSVVFVVAAVVLHGPVVGVLFDLATRSGRRLRAAHDEMALTHQRLVEEQTDLIELEKHAATGVLAAGIAHEINNPLSGIMQCARALREEHMPEDRREKYLSSILEACARMTGILEGLRDYSRRRSAVPTDIDAAELVSACLRSVVPFCEEADVKVVSSLEVGDVQIRAEMTQLKKALINVVMNAIYFSPGGREVSVSATRRGSMWGIAIADRGPGISKENLAKVRDPFFTTKRHGEGTGLGLAISYGVMHSFGGQLSIESELGRGTTVTLWLPAAGGHAHA